MSNKLTDKALLVTLAVSQWTARKLDKRETEEVARRHGTASEVARVSKSLLPFADSLEAIHKKTGELRTFYYQQTLPWANDGSRIIPAANYMDFVQVMRTKVSEWDGLVQAFVAEYPKLRHEAQLILHTLYRDDDYPEPDDIAHKFRADVSFFPVPSSDDFRVSLNDEELARLQSDTEARVADAMGSAMRECWSRLYECVEHARDRLADPKGIFRDSMLENARHLCALLPKLNLTSDPNLERMRQELEGSLLVHNPETLRRAPDVRADTAAKMSDILNKMGAFYVAA